MTTDDNNIHASTAYNDKVSYLMKYKGVSFQPTIFTYSICENDIRLIEMR